MRRPSRRATASWPSSTTRRAAARLPPPATLLLTFRPRTRTRATKRRPASSRRSTTARSAAVAAVSPTCFASRAAPLRFALQLTKCCPTRRSGASTTDTGASAPRPVAVAVASRHRISRFREEGLKQHSAQQGGGGGGSANDLFSQFFGGGGFGGFGGFGGGQQEESGPPKGATITVDLDVTLTDLYLGRAFAVTRDKGVYKPAKGTRQCNCKTKMSTRQIAPGMYQQYPTQTCETCSALKLQRVAEALSVEVERGARDGSEVVFFEQGEPMMDGEPGDLKFKLRTVKGPKDGGFERRGDDLVSPFVVTLEEALVGFDRDITHMDGRAVKLARAGVTRPGDVLFVKGEGMPVPTTTRKGDLYVTLSLAMPSAELTEAQKEGVRALFAGVAFK